MSRRTTEPAVVERYYYSYYTPEFVPESRIDTEVESDLRSRLSMDTWVDADEIASDVHDGMVELTGTVDSILEKRAAGDDAWDTPGVVDVNNQIRVHLPSTRR